MQKHACYKLLCSVLEISNGVEIWVVFTKLHNLYKAQIIILVSKGQTILESIWRFEGSIFDIEIVCLSGI